MQRRPALGVLATVALVAVLVTGCSGDPIAEHLESTGVQPYSEEGDATEIVSEEPADDTYLRAGGAICRDTFAPLQNMDDTPDGVVPTVEIVSSWARAARAGAERLGTLEAPDEDTGTQVLAAQAALQVAATDLDAGVPRAAAGDVPGAEAAIAAAEPDLDAAERLLAEAGLSGCTR